MSLATRDDVPASGFRVNSREEAFRACDQELQRRGICTMPEVKVNLFTYEQSMLSLLLRLQDADESEALGIRSELETLVLHYAKVPVECRKLSATQGLWESLCAPLGLSWRGPHKDTYMQVIQALHMFCKSDRRDEWDDLNTGREDLDDDS